MADKKYSIALTGALGLVGCGITAQALADGHRIIALDIRPSDSDEQLLGGLGETTPDDIAIRRKAIKAHPGRHKYIQCDLTKYEHTKAIIQQESCDAVIHLAAVYSKKDENGVYVSGPSQDVIHNVNTTMSYNIMLIAGELDIRRVVVASSVNSIGMVFSEQPRFDYLPVDEKHPYYPEDAFVELQADSICRRYPSLRIASMRFHWVVPTPMQSRDFLHRRGGNKKDLWSFVSLTKTADACLGAITIEEGWEGHETFFIAARTTCQQASTAELAEEFYPAVKRSEIKGNEALICTEKAERLLGWKDEGYPWDG